MDILNQFGINPLLLAAQVVNFLILLFILKKFMYKPLLKVLDQRKKTIEDSLKNATEIEKRLNGITEKEEQALLRSAKEGEKIVREAGIQGAQIIENANKTAEQILKKTVEDSKKFIEQQQVLLLNQVKGSLSDIVFLSLQKVLGKKVTKEQREIIEEVLKKG